MIQNYHGYKYNCEECKNILYATNHTEARKFGWAIAKGYKKCYCVNCAQRHRKVGRGGKKRIEQIQISI